MDFLDTYKRLDYLCKDLLRSDKGVTSYLDAMEKCSYLCKQVNNWNVDYAKLKNYRRIRNIIAHEPNVSEQNYCSISDILWIEEFHDRILKGTDPLALYDQIIRQDEAQRKSAGKRSEKYRGIEKNSSAKYQQVQYEDIGIQNSNKSEFRYWVSMVMIAIIAVIGIFLACFVFWKM